MIAQLETPNIKNLVHCSKVVCVCVTERERERELNKEQCRGDTWRTCGMYDLGFSGRRVVSLAPQSLYSPGVDCCTH
jgi:hypothetical protein